MRLFIENSLTTLVDPSSSDRVAVREALAYDRIVGRGKIVRDSHLNMAADCFLTGYLPFVLEKLAGIGILPEILDGRKAPPRGMGNSSWLRDYQKEALAAMQAKQRGIVSMVTGSGKTEVFTSFLSGFDCDILVLTPGTSLMHQTADRVAKRLQMTPGKVGDGCAAYKADLLVGIPESVFNHMDEINLSRFGVVIADEVHGAATEVFQGILSRCTEAFYRFGFSATPLDRTDGRNAPIIGQLGKVIYELSPAEAIKRGIIAEPKVEMVRYASPVSPKSRVSESWADMHDEMISQNADRDRVIVELLRVAEGPILLFVKELDHVVRLTQSATLAGIPAVYVIGSMGKKQREKAVNLLVSGAAKVLIATSAFRQAVDIPQIKTVMNTGGGESLIDAVQKLGRGTRLASGKSSVRIIDIADTGCVNCAGGFIHSACKAVASHSGVRRYHYASAGFSVREV